ncbi:antitoxin family protein [Thermococcus sp.]
MGIVVEAIYEDGVFKPLKKLNLPDKTRVIIRVEIFGLLKGWEVNAQEIKDELREIHG